MKLEDLKTEKVIKLFSLQYSCMDEKELWDIIKINKENNGNELQDFIDDKTEEIINKLKGVR